MDKLKWLLTKWWFYLIAFIISLVIPVVINEAYKVGKGYITLWNAADVLAFYGEYLSFVGTVVLGMVAIYQNKKAHQLNEQMQKLQQAQFVSMVSVKSLEINKRSAKYPNFMNQNMREIEILDLTAEGFQSTNCYHIDIEFANSSQFPIVQICAHAGTRKNVNCIVWGMVEVKESAIYIPEQGKQAIRFIVPSEVFEAENNYQLPLSIDFINIFDYRTVATIYLSDLENKTKRNEYTYRLAKFTDVRT